MVKPTGIITVPTIEAAMQHFFKRYGVRVNQIFYSPERPPEMAVPKDIEWVKVFVSDDIDFYLTGTFTPYVQSYKLDGQKHEIDEVF